MSWTKIEYQTAEIDSHLGRMRVMARVGEVVFSFLDIRPGEALGEANAVHMRHPGLVVTAIAGLRKIKQPAERELITRTLKAAASIAWPEA